MGGWINKGTCHQKGKWLNFSFNKLTGFCLPFLLPACLNMASAETIVKESSSLHDATCSGPLYFYSSIYLCLYRCQYCSYFPFTKHFHVWHLPLSWFLSHLFGFFFTFSSPFLAFIKWKGHDKKLQNSPDWGWRQKHHSRIARLEHPFEVGDHVYHDSSLPSCVWLFPRTHSYWHHREGRWMSSSMVGFEEERNKEVMGVVWESLGQWIMEFESYKKKV